MLSFLYSLTSVFFGDLSFQHTQVSEFLRGKRYEFSRHLTKMLDK